MQTLLGNLCTPHIIPVIAAGLAAGLWSRSMMAAHPLGIAAQAGNSRGYRLGRPLMIAAATAATTLVAADFLLG